MTKRVYIAHPIGAETREAMGENIRAVEEICRQIKLDDPDGTDPFIPYYEALGYLDDMNKEERKLGQEINRRHFEDGTFDELWLAGPRISAGMEGEIRLALQYDIPVRCYNPCLREELEEVYAALEKEERF